MELLAIALLLVLVLVWQMLTYRAISLIAKYIPIVKPCKQEEPKVTDPFQKPKEIYSSTNHIVVPKTPTEIRNQNYKKIKEGIEYGDIKRGE